MRCSSAQHTWKVSVNQRKLQKVADCMPLTLATLHVTFKGYDQKERTFSFCTTSFSDCFCCMEIILHTK